MKNRRAELKFSVLLLVAVLAGVVFIFSNSNSAQQSPGGEEQCEEKFTPHPYLALRYKAGPCSKLNNIFLKGPDMPRYRDENYYNILIVGSKMAEQLATGLSEEEHSLEKHLNQKWRPPRGKSFRVLSAAIKGSSAPAWFYQMALFLDRADFVIAFEDTYDRLSTNAMLQMEEPSSDWRKIYVTGDRTTESFFPKFEGVSPPVAISKKMKNYLRYLVYADSLAKKERKGFTLILADPADEDSERQSARRELVSYLRANAKKVEFYDLAEGASLKTNVGMVTESVAKFAGWQRRSGP